MISAHEANAIMITIAVTKIFDLDWLVDPFSSTADSNICALKKVPLGELAVIT